MYSSLASPPDTYALRPVLSPLRGDSSGLVRVGSSNSFVFQYNSMLMPNELFSFNYNFNPYAFPPSILSTSSLPSSSHLSSARLALLP